MSVIVGRALPDVRDGLKPVPAHPLGSMLESGLPARSAPSQVRRPSSATCSESTTRTATSRSTTPSSAWRRTCRCAIRSSTARATSARWTATPPRPTGTPRRGSRRSRSRCWRTSSETVDFEPNFDVRAGRADGAPIALPEPARERRRRHRGRHGHEHPAAQPGRGRQGGRALLDNPEATPDELLKYIKGPDFPTGGTILGVGGSGRLRTGRGSLKVARLGPRSRKPSTGGAPSSSPSSRTRSTRRRWPRRSRPWSRRRSSRASATSRTSPTARDAAGHRAQARRDSERGAQSALQAHLDADHLRRDHARAGRRRAQGDAAQGAARALHRPSARHHRPPHPVRPRKPPRPGSTSSRASRSRRQHRRGHQAHPRPSAEAETRATS